MPGYWRAAWPDEAPDLAATRVRAEHCYLLDERLDDLGASRSLTARVALNVAPQALAHAGRPALLQSCPAACRCSPSGDRPGEPARRSRRPPPRAAAPDRSAAVAFGQTPRATSPR